jgi:hypothetical protein
VKEATVEASLGALRGRRALLALLLLGGGTRALISIVVPVSFDLRDIFLMATGQIQLTGPWILVESLMVSVWKLATHTSSIPLGWWNTPPSLMPIDFQLLSLLLRLPALASDLAVAIVLYVMVARTSSTRNALLASALWFLNPYTFLAVEMLGVPDVAAALLVVLASLLMLHKRNVLSAVAFAGGVALKLFPIFLLPAFLILPSGVRDKGRQYEALWVLLALLGFLGYFVWASPEGISALVEYSPVTQPLTALFTALPGTRISIPAIALIIMYSWTYEFGRRQGLLISELLLPILLVYLTFSNPPFQYFVWVLPFLVLDIMLVEGKHVSLFAGLIVILLVDGFFSTQGFLAPNGYSLFLFQPQRQILPGSSFLLSLLNAALYATTFIYALEIVRGWARPNLRMQDCAT